MLTVKVGQLLQKARKSQGKTQQDLAKSTGISQPVIARLESGKKKPTWEALQSLALHLKEPIQVFETGERQPGTDLEDIAIELNALGLRDLYVSNARIPGAFRHPEEILVLAVVGNSPSPRVIEGLAAVLAWNSWRAPLIAAFSEIYDARARYRIAWLSDIVLSIHQNRGFPGGVKSRSSLESLLKQADRPAESDSLGRPAQGDRFPPIWKRWNITYDANLATFRERAEQLMTPSGKHDE